MQSLMTKTSCSILKLELGTYSYLLSTDLLVVGVVAGNGVVPGAHGGVDLVRRELDPLLDLGLCTQKGRRLLSLCQTVRHCRTV